MTKHGIDVSDNQGKIDWSAVKGAGVEFAILRTVRGSLLPDHYFETNYTSCRENRIQIGGYKYSYATSVAAARREAEAVINLMGCRDLDLPIFFDAEDVCQRVLSKQLLTDIIHTFLDIIEGGGYQAAIYCNLDWYKNVIDVSAFPGIDFWVARYGPNNGETNAGYKPDVGEIGWQYTSRGSVPGISGNVDLDLLYKDYAAAQVPAEMPADMDYFEEPKVYKNGSTPEPVYSSTAGTQQIGSLDPHEECDCIGTYRGMACVVYSVTGTSTKKVGWVRWLGGIK